MDGPSSEFHTDTMTTSPNPPSGSPLRVVVDLNRCQGYGQCCYAAPRHFRIDGVEALSYDPSPSAADHADVERARISCPVQAIRIGGLPGDAA